MSPNERQLVIGVADVDPKAGARYAAQRLYQAVYALAIGEHKARSRLYTALVLLQPLFQADFPVHLRGEFAALRRDAGLESTPRGYTIRRMRDRTASKFAARLWQLHESLDEFLHPRV